MIPDSGALNAVSRDFSKGCPHPLGKIPNIQEVPIAAKIYLNIPIKITVALARESKLQQRYKPDDIRYLSFYYILLSNIAFLERLRNEDICFQAINQRRTNFVKYCLPGAA